MVGGAGRSAMLVNPLAAVAPSCLGNQPLLSHQPAIQKSFVLAGRRNPGASDAGVDVDALASLGRDLNRADRIDRSAVYRLKIEALGRIWIRFSHDDRFDAYSRTRRSARSVRPFLRFGRAAWSRLASLAGSASEPRFPGGCRDDSPTRKPPAVSSMAAMAARRAAAQASRAVALVHDLPVGVDAGGADAWAWQDVMAQGISVSTPPDIYNTLGQNWGLPPFIPHKLQADCYEPFIRTIRACLRHAGGLRIDHAMGLFRLFWIPDGSHPREGTYVRYPYKDLLGIIALRAIGSGIYRGGRFGYGRTTCTPATGTGPNSFLSSALVRREAAGHLFASGLGGSYHARSSHRRGPLDGERFQTPTSFRTESDRRSHG